MQLTFLEADVPLTKSYVLEADGSITKSSYPNVWQVTSITEDCASMVDFEALLNKHAKKGRCLLKGDLSRPLVKESRAGTTDRNATTLWICLDLDGIPAKGASLADVEAIMQALGLGDVTYLVQWSGSQNITSMDLRCHIFIMLTRPMSAPMIKQWLIQKNFELSLLRDTQKLTKTNMSLTWGLDITACQSDKLIYIAPPSLTNIKSPLGRTARVQLVPKLIQTYDLHHEAINGVAQNRALIDARVIELRDALALPKRKISYKQSGSFEVMVKPDEAVATEMRTERGYVYFNLNGGDSWAYWHPEDNPKYIHNFKGEPVYLTSELLPDYWNTLKSAPIRTSSSGLQFLAFLDKSTSTYWRGTYDLAADDLQLHQAKNETQIRHFCTQYGIMQDDFIPEWNIVFDPQDSVRVDQSQKYVNTFQLTEYMKQPTVPKTVSCPSGIFKLISHVLADDQDCIEHFMNWCAFIVQYRTRTETAWIFQGVEGTGKGMLVNRVLRPMLGMRQTSAIRAAQLFEKFNLFAKDTLLVFVDEIEAKMFTNEPTAMANLKNYITEGTIQIRGMYTNALERDNYTNVLMSTNKPEALPIPPEDRRHNIAPYQPLKFTPTDAEVEQIVSEIQAFHDYLMCFAVDTQAARTNIKNEARATLIGLSQTTIESTADALKKGDFQHFLNQLPTNKPNMLDFREQARIDSFASVLSSIIDRTNPTTGVCAIARDELFTMFSYSSAEMPKTPAKFTKLLGHRQIVVGPLRVNGKNVQGVRVVWQDFGMFQAYRAEHFSAIPVSVTT